MLQFNTETAINNMPYYNRITKKQLKANDVMDIKISTKEEELKVSIQQNI